MKPAAARQVDLKVAVDKPLDRPRGCLDPPQDRADAGDQLGLAGLFAGGGVGVALVIQRFRDL